MDRLEKLWAKHQYDLLIDFTALPLTGLACARESAPPSIGFQRQVETPRGRIDLALAYDRTFLYSDEAPLRDLMLRLVSPWGIGNVDRSIPCLSIGGDALQKADVILEAKGLAKDRFIVLHPGGERPNKRWPASHWHDLLKLLRGGSPLPLLILGAHGDTLPVHDILNGRNGPYAESLICNRIEILSAVIKRAALIVCNDSAAMYIAAAVGTDSISMFGPVSPERSVPSIDDKCRVLYDNMFCSPCTLYYSPDRCRRGINFCMYAIKPEEVYRGILERTSQ
jgi:ADP-heptose:LPS heptosyltransferase